MTEEATQPKLAYWSTGEKCIILRLQGLTIRLPRPDKDAIDLRLGVPSNTLCDRACFRFSLGGAKDDAVDIPIGICTEVSSSLVLHGQRSMRLSTGTLDDDIRRGRVVLERLAIPFLRGISSGFGNGRFYCCLPGRPSVKIVSSLCRVVRFLLDDCRATSLPVDAGKGY
jgi:hypothetical protein